MIILLATLAAAISGALIAKRRGGNRMDIAQYALIFGLAAFLSLSIIAMIAMNIWS